MRAYLSLVLVTLLFLAVGCDGNSNPSSAIHDTIWVVDSNHLPRMHNFKGRVKLQTECAMEPSFAGVTVTYVPTGATTTTDDSGYFDLTNISVADFSASPALTFSKVGYYPFSVSPYELGYESGTKYYVANTILSRLSIYSATFVSKPQITSEQYYIAKDTLVFEGDSIWVRKSVVIDSARWHVYYFSAVALDGHDQKTSLAQVIPLISKTAEFDHQDRSNLATAYVFTSSGSPASFGFSDDLVRYWKLSTGDTIYVSATSTSDCSQGWTPGLRKATPIPVVIQ